MYSRVLQISIPSSVSIISNTTTTIIIIIIKVNGAFFMTTGVITGNQLPRQAVIGALLLLLWCLAPSADWLLLLLPLARDPSPTTSAYAGGRSSSGPRFGWPLVAGSPTFGNPSSGPGTYGGGLGNGPIDAYSGGYCCCDCRPALPAMENARQCCTAN